MLQRDSRELMMSLRKEWEARGALGMPENEQDPEYRNMKLDCYRVVNLKKEDINGTRELWLAATSQKKMYELLLKVKDFAHFEMISYLHNFVNV